MAQYIRLEIDQGTSWQHQLQLFKDNAGNVPIDDFTDVHFLMQVRKTVSSSRIMFTLADANIKQVFPDIEDPDGEIVVIDPLTGVIELRLGHEASTAIRIRENTDWWFDLEMYAPPLFDTPVRVIRVCQGDWIMSPEGTREDFTNGV